MHFTKSSTLKCRKFWASASVTGYHPRYWSTYPALFRRATVVVVVSFISDRIQQWYRNRKHFVVTRNAHNIETLLYSAGGHQESCKAHQAGNQKHETKLKSEYGVEGLITSWIFQDTITSLTPIITERLIHNRKNEQTQPTDILFVNI